MTPRRRETAGMSLLVVGLLTLTINAAACLTSGQTLNGFTLLGVTILIVGIIVLLTPRDDLEPGRKMSTHPEFSAGSRDGDR